MTRITLSIDYFAGKCQWCCLLLFILTLFGACSGNERQPAIQVPQTPPLSRSVLGYGVISASYSPLYAEAGVQSAQEGYAGYLRRGAIAEVLERRQVDGSPWVFARSGEISGWLPSDAMQIYDSEAQAQTAAEKMGR
jgi:hypothetical protein